MLSINREMVSKNFRSRGDEAIEFLVLHYTAVPLATTFGIFTNDPSWVVIDKDYFANEDETKGYCKGEVSAHYVISETGNLYQLVAEENAAFHAGLSAWNGKKNLNNSSIGIEHESLGYNWLKLFPSRRGQKVVGSNKTWLQFTEDQIVASIELCKQIIKEHNIAPYNVVGHSDIACGRKFDPGPLFPWKKFADAGVGLWFDYSDSTVDLGKNMPEDKISWMQDKLLEYGYDCPQTNELDEQTKNVMIAFQMHFRPSNIDGKIDFECMQIIDSLCARKQWLMKSGLDKFPLQFTRHRDEEKDHHVNDYKKAFNFL